MLKEKIRNKEKLVGAYVQLTDISISRIMGLVGYDFIWVDTEHSYMSYETLLSHIISLKSTGTPVIVRAPQNDLTATKKILEMGPDGIIFPRVRTLKEAKEVASYCVYPPRGDRGFGPMGAVDYGLKNAFEFTKACDKELCVFIQIEDKETLENLDEIMTLDTIDGYIYGPNDLAGSWGMLGEHLSDKITCVMREGIKKLHDNGKYVGIASGGFSEEIVSHWSGFNPDMLIAGADFDFIREGALTNLKTLKKIHKL